MPTRRVSPPLADAADMLGGQLKNHLRLLARILKPHVKTLEKQYLARLQELGFESRQRAALASLTLGAAVKLVVRGRRITVFLEQVDYNGRRLAKLNLPPSQIVQSLTEYDRLVTPLLRRLLPDKRADYQWVREQLQFCVILTLNKAYYQVREREAESFYELFRAELDSRTLDDLLAGSLAVLTRFCGAREAQLFLLDEERESWVRRAKTTAGSRSVRGPRKGYEVSTRILRKARLAKPRFIQINSRSAPALLDPKWKSRYASVWSVPLLDSESVAGVMQFAFAKRYAWLPREQELLEAAAERCTVATEKARLVEDLAAREEQIRQLAEHMLHIEEVERRRISSELHDEAGQSLLYIRLQLEMLETEIGREKPAWGESIRNIREVSERTILEVRRLIAALSPAVLEQLGLAPALRQLVTRFRNLYPCRVKLNLSPLEPLPKRTETIVYRLVQECCNNIAKHSQAGNVNISLSSADGLLRLDVEDDGIGFQVSSAFAQRHSFGLAGMRERVTLLGGNFEIESRESNKSRSKRRKPGTRITAQLPIPRTGKHR